MVATIPCVNIRAEEILRELPDGPVKMVELGVHRGALSERLLAARWNLTLYMVDLWEPTADYPGERNEAYATAVARTIQYGKRARIICGNSIDVACNFADSSVDLVFVDADHSYAGVKADLEAWAPKVRSGGVLGGHDYRSDKGYGVIKAVDEFTGKAGLRLGRNHCWFVTR